MAAEQSHTLEIQISNKTKHFTLENPRTHLESGLNLVPPSPALPPGSSDSSRFSSDPGYWSIGGVLSYEAESFTLAILFRIPLNLEAKEVKVGVELSLDKAHLGDLSDTFYRIRGGWGTYSRVGTSGDICDIYKKCQEPAQVTAGPVKVMATMSHGQNAVIKVVVAEQEDGGKESPGMGKDGHGK